MAPAPNLAQILMLIEGGLLLEAEAALRAGGMDRGRDAASLYARARLADAQKDSAAARTLAAKAGKLAPTDPGVAALLARLQSADGNHRLALATAERAVRAHPRDIGLRRIVAVCQMLLKQFAAAEAAWRQVLALAPRDLEAKQNLAALLRLLNRFDESIAMLCSMEGQVDAIEIGLGICDIWDLTGRYDDCLDWCVATARDASTPELERSYGCALIRAGDYAEGFRRHDRRAQKDLDERIAHIPYWDGVTTGGTLLLHGEQGIGDEIQFMRYAHHLTGRFDRVVYLTRPRLTALFSSHSAGIEVVGSLPDGLDARCRASVMSLPHLLQRHDGEGLRDAVPYLAADPARVAQWRGRLGAGDLKVGIAWRGNEDIYHPMRRAFPLQALHPLSQVPGVRLIALQTGEALDERRHLRPRFAVEAHDLDQGPDGFVDTAAVISLCDLVVTTDTSIGHLAGALDVPVWLALSKAGDWRWGRSGTETPWYPRMRLFRQDRLDDWAPVFARMAAELARMASGTS